MRPHDQQPGLIKLLSRKLGHPALTAEELGRALIMLEGFVRSGLVTQTEASTMLAPVREAR